MSSNGGNSPPIAPAEMSQRRGSISQATLSTLFQHSNSMSGAGGTSAFPHAVSTPAAGEHRRRMSTGVGLSGTSPTCSFLRRGSFSNSGETFDESAIDEEDMPNRASLQRRMSIGTGIPTWGFRGIPSSPSQNEQGFNWTAQLRSRAESLTMAHKPTWAPSSPPRGMPPISRDAPKPVAEMPPPPSQASSMNPPRQTPRKPDPFQERILKGDFYMD